MLMEATASAVPAVRQSVDVKAQGRLGSGTEPRADDFQ